PSMWTSQGVFNMGGRVMPTQTNVLHLPRSSASYGGLKTETNQVRGHPFALAQTQKSTDPKSKDTFDNVKLLETRETDGTKGGFSTFRYSQVENPSIKSMQPFNQVNVSSAPQTTTSMGIPATDTIHLSLQQAPGKYDELKFDNTVDYRNQIGKGNE